MFGCRTFHTHRRHVQRSLRETPANGTVVQHCRNPANRLAPEQPKTNSVAGGCTKDVISNHTAVISDKDDDFFSPSQSGFDSDDFDRWHVAMCQPYKNVIKILGIELSSAFDTIFRKTLLGVLYSYLLPTSELCGFYYRRQKLPSG